MVPEPIVGDWKDGGEGERKEKVRESVSNLTKEIQSISFKDAQTNPALLDPHSKTSNLPSSPSSSTAKTTLSKRNRSRNKKEVIINSPDKTEKKKGKDIPSSEKRISNNKIEEKVEDLGQKVKVNRRTRRSERFSKEKEKTLIEDQTMLTETTLTPTTSFHHIIPTRPTSNTVVENGISSPKKPSKSHPSIDASKISSTSTKTPTVNGDDVRIPTGPRSLTMNASEQSKRSSKNSKETKTETVEEKIKKIERSAAEKVQDDQNKRNIIRQNEEAIAHHIMLQSMKESFIQDQEAGKSWCENMIKHLSESQTEFRHRCIGHQMRMIWEITRPNMETLIKRNEVIKEVEELLNRRWPGCGLIVAPFGSTATGLVEATSDIDLCLLDPTRPHGVGSPEEEVLPLPKNATYSLLFNDQYIGVKGVPDYYSVTLIARALGKDGYSFREIIPIRHANVPIVKFVHSRSELAGDLNVNDSFGLRNSDLISKYIDICPNIVAPVVFCIKKWASRRKINDPSGKSGIFSLNSYTVCLIALQYLQIQGIVPNLQSPTLLKTLNAPKDFIWQRPKGRARKVVEDKGDAPKITIDPKTGGRLFDTTFCSLNTEEEHWLAEQDAKEHQTGFSKPYSIQNSQGSEMEQKTLLGNLIEGFFEWLSTFDFENCGISLREGHPFRRYAKVSSKDGEDHLNEFPYVKPFDRKWDDDALICQDPFILDRNTSGAVIKTTRMMIVQEARRAFMILTKPTKGNDDNSLNLPEAMMDCEYEQLLEFNQRLIKGWSKERLQNIQKESESRLKDPNYYPNYRKVNDKRVIEARTELNKQERKQKEEAKREREKLRVERLLQKQKEEEEERQRNQEIPQEHHDSHEQHELQIQQAS